MNEIERLTAAGLALAFTGDSNAVSPFVRTLTDAQCRAILRRMLREIALGVESNEYEAMFASVNITRHQAVAAMRDQARPRP